MLVGTANSSRSSAQGPGHNSGLTVLGKGNKIEFLAFLGVRHMRREVWVLSSATSQGSEPSRGTHGKSIKVGPPPNTQAFSNLPVAMSGLSISPLAIWDTKTFIESGQETFLVGLTGIEVSSGATVS
jgi:hypothetical protein